MLKNIIIILITFTLFGCQKKVGEKIYLSCNGIYKSYIKDEPHSNINPRDEKLTLVIEHKIYPEKSLWHIDSGNLNLMLGFFPIDMRDAKTKEGQIISTYVTDTEIQGKSISKYEDGTSGYRELMINRINGEITYETEAYSPKLKVASRSEYKGVCEVNKKI